MVSACAPRPISSTGATGRSGTLLEQANKTEKLLSARIDRTSRGSDENANMEDIENERNRAMKLITVARCEQHD